MVTLLHQFSVGIPLKITNMTFISQRPVLLWCTQLLQGPSHKTTISFSAVVEIYFLSWELFIVVFTKHSQKC